MAGFTNRGKVHLFDLVFRNAAEPTNYFVALVTSATAPGPDTNTMSDLTEINAGNGYTSGGYSLDRNSTDFNVLTEDDGADKAILQVKDVVFTASGGNLPNGGSGARYAVLTDDNVTVANRIVIAYWSLGSDRVVSNTQALTLVDLELNATE